MTSVDFHNQLQLLVTGFDNGVFLIHEMHPDVNLIHSLSISDQSILSVTFNPSGDWIAFGCSQLGQLLVWEWQSETYVLKQQGHFNNMASVSFSPDGTVMATGGHDGKVKLWATTSGFCFVTFAEHTAAVSAVKYSIGKHISRSFFFFKFHVSCKIISNYMHADLNLLFSLEFQNIKANYHFRKSGINFS